ncbi:MAG: M15 family metallopeptidase [Treponema sp.]|nr:M15 family metallopeptidase [Treponema sp.]
MQKIDAEQVSSSDNAAGDNTDSNNMDNNKTETDFSASLTEVLSRAQLPAQIRQRISGIAGNPAFLLDLFTVLQEDPYLWVLVDKEHALGENYEPDDLVALTGGSYRIGRQDLRLRRQAALSLEEMSAAAAREGLTLTASSSYRTYAYQVEVYARNVREMGREAADRESARPGHSQHQLGLVVDFGSITDEFAQTAGGVWLAANASRFGWSLSYPNGYEDVTGYRWESWHYRYVGVELAQFIDNYFDGIQQYALRFIYEWVNRE